MGTDLDQYVHPDRISSQLICPICTQVLKNPVQTSTDHLFCEDELLEWMTRSNICPVSKQVLDPEKITKPSRIITNMLAELEIFCPNKSEGCPWSGPHERLDNHVSSCEYRPRTLLFAELKVMMDRNKELEVTNSQLEARNELLNEENVFLKGLVEDYQHRLRVFHALLPTESRPLNAFEGDDNSVFLETPLDESICEGDDLKGDDAGNISFSSDRSNDFISSDVERLRKLRALRSLQQEFEADAKAAAYRRK